MSGMPNICKFNLLYLKTGDLKSEQSSMENCLKIPCRGPLLFFDAVVSKILSSISQYTIGWNTVQVLHPDGNVRRFE